MATVFPIVNTLPTGYVNAAALFTQYGIPINDLAAATENAPRIGGRATTNATQSIPATTATSLNNGGSAAWTATEDSGGFVSATGGSTAPIVIPTGLGGLYAVGFGYTQSVTATTRGFANLLISGSAANLVRDPFTGDNTCSGATTLPLAPGNTVGLQAFTTPTGLASIGCYVYAYRIGN